MPVGGRPIYLLAHECDGARQRQRGRDAEDLAQIGHRLGEGGHVVAGSEGMMRGRLASAQAEKWEPREMAVSAHVTRWDPRETVPSGPRLREKPRETVPHPPISAFSRPDVD